MYDNASLIKGGNYDILFQASWRGYILRKKLLAALEYAQCDFGDEEEDDDMDLNDEFDFEKFVDVNQVSEIEDLIFVSSIWCFLVTLTLILFA